MEKARIGIIGVGQMGSIHLRLAMERNDVVVEAVADIDEEKLKQARAAGVKRLYRDYKRMIDEGGLDAVIVATPPRYHVEQALYAYRSGLRVLLEKPVSTSLSGAEELYREAGDTDRVMVAFSLRYHRFYQRVKEVLEGDLGAPLALWHIALGRIPRSIKWVGDRGMSGGMLNENGVHIVYLHMWLAGSVETVRARAWRVLEGITIEDNIVLEASHGEVLSTFVQSWSGGHRWRKWGIVAGKGRVTCEGYLSGECTFSTIDGREWKEEIPGDIKDMYRRQLGCFIDSVINGARPPTRLAHGVAVQEVVEAAYESARRGGEPVRLPLSKALSLPRQQLF